MGNRSGWTPAAGAPFGDGKLPNVRWSPHIDAPLWPWTLSGWIFAALFILMFIYSSANR